MSSKLLYRELVKTEMSCVPTGIHELNKIYNFVKEGYPELCDDEIHCKWHPPQPEWKHRVRTVLANLKKKGRIDQQNLERGWYRITLNVRWDDKVILDACCGGRQMWHKENKQHPNALYMDIRQEEPGCIKQQPNFQVKPDILCDYRDMRGIPSNTFYHVAWDIPHLLKWTKGLITTKYGALDQGSKNWQDDLRRGFQEIWRVLKMHGTLVFKYNDLNIKASEMLSIFPVNPLYGALTKKGVNNTFFFVFVKLPEDVHIPFCTRTIEEMDIDAYDIINAMRGKHPDFTEHGINS